MAQLGQRNILRITRETFNGVYLDADELGEVLLPRGEVPLGSNPGEELDVFLYRDSEDRLIATMRTPAANVGEIAVLRVRDYDERIGAFLDWGLLKDLLLPHREQSTPVYPGEDVVVMVRLDPVTNRLFATQRLHLHLDERPTDYKRGQPVHLMIARETSMGWGCVIEGKHLGLLYQNPNMKIPFVGQEMEGYIANIRPDGKIDLTLESSARPRVFSLADEILEQLNASGGKLPYDDDTVPEVIRDKFGSSKKAFKQAIGQLYKTQKIVLTRPGIALAQAPQRRGR